MAADGRKTVAVDAAMHKAWAAEAKKQGVSIATYVTAMVEASRRGVTLVADQPPIVVRLPRPITSTTVSPKDCTNRVPVGTFCKQCGTTHTKKG